MLLRVTCDLVFNIEIPTPFILMLRPRSGAQQWITRETYNIEPNLQAYEFTDFFGNLCQRIIAPIGTFSVFTQADVKISKYIDEAPGANFIDVQNLPDNVLSYLLPSRYCESDRFSELANNITYNQLPGYNQVAAIENWLRNTISYIPGSSDYAISAIEVNYKQSGVCRDLAHLGIALCRSLSIPARMVVGYLHKLDPMDMHAWFEAYVGGRWYTFDATQTGRKGGYVAVGYGLDAANVAVFNQFGPAVYPTKQVIKVEQIKN
ncbi:Transglutaminase-like enzyme, putative cysteine protease [Flaviramulus basaltis]|uniref:Transglutaminase-like enzyme, putative cysteine protease n=1 Tax=Flaviramulus basaltis TaxID=369401 RepID=A0A1K2ILC2_9FLAO|nr:transglutaminase family protein [Flaviramulus basaltis]SFZ92467.1 Transglutaminase-like enzyme, putative cysteine protease [Flaviramulus basaltis]